MKKFTTCLLLLLASCALPGQTGTQIVTTPVEIDEASASQAEAELKATLDDPDSAHFQNIHGRTSAGILYVCGEVNAKNRFGGYAGFTQFYVASTGEVSIEDQYSTKSNFLYGAPVCR